MLSDHLDPRTNVVWDITYACPMRCGYCYSESGRRASRQLDADGIRGVIRALVISQPNVVAFSGGEPTLVPELADAAKDLRAAGVMTNLYTTGFGFGEQSSHLLASVFHRIHVSLDGASSATHDELRRRHGAFEAAMSALVLLLETRRRLALDTRVGIEMTVVRENFCEIAELCELVAGRLPELDFIAIGAAIPSGLGSRQTFAETSLLDDALLAQLRSPELRARLRAVLPGTTRLVIYDNWHLLPAGLEDPEVRARIPIQIEPDGSVRAFPIYEGTVGNVRETGLAELWARARARHEDPWMLQTLSGITSLKDWADATRKIDARYGSADDLIRLRKRR